MNKRKLALLAALPAAVLMANNAMAAADVYGKINITVQNNSADNNMSATNPDFYDNWTVDSNASRLGFKASTDLGDTGLKGVVKLEYQADADDGTTVFTQRNIYAGVQGGFGTIIAGKFDTPMKESQGKVDQFNDYILGDIAAVLSVGEVRASNIVMYSTPKFDSGVGANIAFMPGEDNGVEGTTVANGKEENNGIADIISASIHFDSENLYLALAADQSMGVKTNSVTADGSGADILRAVAQFKMDAFTLGAIYQTAESAEDNNDQTNPIPAAAVKIATIKDWFVTPAAPNAPFSVAIEDQDGMILSTSYTLGSHVFKAQYGVSEAGTPVVGDKDVEIENMVVGYDYNLGKDAKVFAYWADWAVDYKTAANVKMETNADTFGVGYEQKF